MLKPTRYKNISALELLDFSFLIEAQIDFQHFLMHTSFIILSLSRHKHLVRSPRLTANVRKTKSFLRDRVICFDVFLSKLRWNLFELPRFSTFPTFSIAGKIHFTEVSESFRFPFRFISVDRTNKVVCIIEDLPWNHSINKILCTILTELLEHNFIIAIRLHG